MSNECVLVTGGGGFLGRYVVEALCRRGDRVRSLSRRRYPELEALGVEQFQCDLGREPATLVRALEGVDVVHHTAALAGIWGKWSTYYRINTEGTRQLLAACRKARVPRMVYTSSPSVTFDGRSQEGVDESVGYARRFDCYYPKSKAIAEQEVLAASGEGTLLTCALRPHLIWGPRDQHLIPRLLQRAKSGQLRRVGDGTNLIDTIYVENAADAQIQAADALRDGGAPAGKAYFLSQGEPVRCWDWINEILGLVNLPPLAKSIPYRAAWLAGAVLEGSYRLLGREDEPRMTRFLAAQLAKPHYFNISAAQRDFGYTPKVSLADGMTRLEAWLQQQPIASA